MEPFATYTQAFAHVGVLGTYVAPDCRRQGVARHLIDEVIVERLL
jgi:ribosomal protein S18 acetylase RimI-like enzyme